MNEFLFDNFKLGNSISIRINNALISGTIIYMDNDIIKIKDDKGVQRTFKGCVFHYYCEMENDINNEASNIIEKSQSKDDKNSKNNSEPRPNEGAVPKAGPKVVGRIDLDTLNKMMSFKKKDNTSNNKTEIDGIFPEDGTVKKKERDYWVVSDNDMQDTDIHLYSSDIIQKGLINNISVGMKLRYLLEYDGKAYRAKFAFFDMSASELLNDFSDTATRSQSYHYVIQKLDKMVGNKDQRIFPIITHILEKANLDNNKDREIALKGVNIARSIGDPNLIEKNLKVYLGQILVTEKQLRSSVLIQLAECRKDSGRKREDIMEYIESALDLTPNDETVMELYRQVNLMPRNETGTVNDLVVDKKSYKESLSPLLKSDTDFNEVIKASKSSCTESEIHKKACEYCMSKVTNLYESFVKTNSRNASNLNTLEKYHDSAFSYYLEALSLGELDIHILSKMTCMCLKMALAICMKSEGEYFNIGMTLPEVAIFIKKSGKTSLFVATLQFISNIGSRSPLAWNALIAAPDGLAKLYFLFDKENRKMSFEYLNRNEGTEIDISLFPAVFLSQVFKNRKEKTEKLLRLNESVRFNVEDMNPTADDMDMLNEYRYFFSATDLFSYQKLCEITQDLMSFKESNSRERLDILHKSRRNADSIIYQINQYPTFLGKSLFLPVIIDWKRILDSDIAESVALNNPKFEIYPQEPYIQYYGDTREIVLKLKNIGQSKSQGYKYHYELVYTLKGIDKDIFDTEKKEDIQSDDEVYLHIDIPFKRLNEDTIGLTIEVYPQVRDSYLEPAVFSGTFTQQPKKEDLFDEKSLKWNTNTRAVDEMFKGRDLFVTELWDHYTSHEYMRPYILYGLTRMGKSSILTALGKRIKGKKVEINEKEYSIFPFSWTLSDFTSVSAGDIWNTMLHQHIFSPLNLHVKEKGCDNMEAWNKLSEMSNRKMRASDFDIVLHYLQDMGIHPLFLVDEFSFMRDLIDSHKLERAFMHDLREKSYNGLASFIYAGTYDVKAFYSNPNYGISGQLVNAIIKPVNEIARQPAEELMDVMSDKLQFTAEAKEYIHILSGDVPYFIQMICLNCAHFAIENTRMTIGYPELDYVVDILTHKRTNITRRSYIHEIAETTFQGNQIVVDENGEASDWDTLMRMNVEERQKSLLYLTSCLTSCFVKAGSDQRNRCIPVPKETIKSMWMRNGLSNDPMLFDHAFNILVERRIIAIDEKNEDKKLYYLRVDLFRRWWAVNHFQDVDNLKS